MKRPSTFLSNTPIQAPRITSPLVLYLLSRTKLCSAYHVQISPIQHKNIPSLEKLQVTPPVAPYDTFHLVSKLSGSELPDFFLRTAELMNSHTFQLKLNRLFCCPMVVAVGDADIAQEILQHPLTTKPKAVCESFDCLNKGIPSIFTSNGDSWHRKRKGLSKAFAHKYLEEIEKTCAKKFDEWEEEKLSVFIERGEEFDVGQEMVDITLSTISEAAFEYQMSKDERESFVHDLRLCFEEYCFKSTLNPLRQIFGLFIPERRQADRARDRLHSLSKKIINAYRKLQNPRTDTTTMIDLIVNSDSYKNDDERAAEVTVLLAAGFDTTAYTAAWTLKELAKNPEEQQKLRESLSSMDKKEWHLKSNKPLKNVVDEAMRLNPVAAGASIRTIGADLVHSTKYDFPQGTIAFIPLILVLRNFEVFKDPHSFRPSRWNNASPEMVNAFMPFSRGKQNCPGQALAYAEINRIVSQLCGKYELELVDEGSTEFSLFLRPIKTMIRVKRLNVQ